MISADDADTNEDRELSEGELSVLTVRQLKALAAELNYEITATAKAAIITEILAAQDVDTTGTLTEEDLALFTVAGILAIAEARNYTMTSTAETAKATVITEFLAAQEAAAGGGGGS